MSGCGTCLFYIPVKGPDGKPVAAGECRRHPPGLTPLLEHGGRPIQDSDGSWKWPSPARAKWIYPHVPADFPICGDYFCPPDPARPKLMTGGVPEPDAMLQVPRAAWDFLQARNDEKLGQAAPSAGDGVPATPDVGERQGGPRLYDPARE